MDDEASRRIDEAIRRIASKKTPTAEELAVLLLYRRGQSLARIAKTMEQPESTGKGAVGKLQSSE